MIKKYFLFLGELKKINLQPEDFKFKNDVDYEERIRQILTKNFCGSLSTFSTRDNESAGRAYSQLINAFNQLPKERIINIYNDVTRSSLCRYHNHYVKLV